MNTRTITVFAIALALGAFVSPGAQAQSTHFDIELGYQWLDVTGNEDLYRTQINQEEGVVLRGLSVNWTDPTGDASFADNLQIEASGFGGNPAGRFRLWMGLKKSYRLRLSYNQFENFSALPAYANPEIDDGVIPGQHTWDRDRKMVNLELEILPDHSVTPIVGYRWNQIDGPRNTTYRVGQDEFQLSSELEETEQEIYAGITFKTNRFWGTLIQGWRDYEATDRLSLAPGEGSGNNDQPVLGQDQYLDDFQRSVTSNAETPVTTANLQGRLGERMGLELSFVRADVEGDTSSSEMLTGSLVSFRIGRFFQGLDQSISSQTENPYWRGEVRFNYDFSQSVRLDVGYETRHRELEGWAMISSLYLDTLNFAGLDPKDIEDLVEAQNGYERDDEILSGRLNIREVGPLVVWVEAALKKTELDVSQDVSEIVVPGGQEGQWERTVDIFGAGGALVLGNARISLDIVSESADDVIVRYDFDDRVTMRGRVDWSLARWLRIVTTGELIQLSNGASDVGYDAETEHFAIDLNFEPTDGLTFRLAYDDYDTETRMPILVPQTLSPSTSIYSENGRLLEGGLQWQISLFNLDLGYSTFENTGTFDFDMDRAFARVGVDFSDHWAAAVEYESNEYSEKVLTLAEYDATRYGVYLRWHR